MLKLTKFVSTMDHRVSCQQSFIVLIIFCVALLPHHWIDCIPINTANSKLFEDHHLNRPLRSNPPPRYPGNYQEDPHQPGHGVPEEQEFWRLQSQKQFKRGAAVSPDYAKVAPGKFQHGPPEAASSRSGRVASENNFHFVHDPYAGVESRMTRHLHEFSSSQGENREHVVLRQGTQQDHFTDTAQERKENQRSYHPPRFGFPDLHREETYFPSREPYIVSPHLSSHLLKESERFREKNINSEVQHNDPDDHHQTQQRFHTFVEKSRKLQPPQDTRIPARDVTSVPQRNAIGASTTIPVMAKENPVLSIEYDVSDNDVTYETTMEIADTN